MAAQWCGMADRIPCVPWHQSIEITVSQDQGMHQADQVKRTDQPYNTQPRSSVAGSFPLASAPFRCHQLAANFMVAATTKFTAVKRVKGNPT